MIVCKSTSNPSRRPSYSLSFERTASRETDRWSHRMVRLVLFA
jgi:hypothetical protein